MDFHEIVEGKIDRKRVAMVREFLGVTSRQPREAPHVLAHLLVMGLHEACRNVGRIRIAAKALAVCARANAGAVFALRPTIRRFAVGFDKLGEIHFGTEDFVYRGNVAIEPVSRDLRAVNNPVVQVANELQSVFAVTVAYQIGNDQLGVGI
jgi:hypothetical protein